MGEIEKVPLIEDLEKFALKLQPEHRSRLYRTAESFFCVGAMQGAFAGLDSSIHTTSPKKINKRSG